MRWLAENMTKHLFVTPGSVLLALIVFIAIGLAAERLVKIPAARRQQVVLNNGATGAVIVTRVQTFHTVKEQ